MAWAKPTAAGTYLEHAPEEEEPQIAKIAAAVPVVLAPLPKHGATSGGIEAISGTLGSLRDSALDDGANAAAGGDAARRAACEGRLRHAGIRWRPAVPVSRLQRRS